MGLALTTFEDIFGWIYFLTWSATFYPQVYLIFKRRTTAGFSTDFMTINIVGFIAYFIFTFASYTSASVSTSYKLHTGYPPQVTLSDVLFAFHGAILCIVLIIQLCIYPPRTPPRPPVLLICSVVQIAVFFGLGLCLLGRLDWFVYLRLSGWVKVSSSVVKHFPQVFLNRQRQSTVGWSFSMVCLDVVGGSFSIAQQVVTCIRISSLAPFTSNLPKTFLAVESLLFDFYFIAQHTLWYTDRHDVDVEGPKHIEDAALMPQ